MNALLRAPSLTAENVLKAIREGDESYLQLAETFDVEPSNFTLRRVVADLEDRKLIRSVQRKGQPERLVAKP